jgi:DNA-binding transcriptional MerR regulator
MLTIGRLGALAEIAPKTLRYYDRVGLVRPTARTPAGYRVYSEEAEQRLRFIRQAKALGMSLADIRRILAVRDEGAAPCQHVQTLVRQNLSKVEGQIAQLQRLKTDLGRLQRLLKDSVPPKAESAEDCPCFSLIRDFHKLPQPRSRRGRRRGHHA